MAGIEIKEEERPRVQAALSADFYKSFRAVIYYLAFFIIIFFWSLMAAEAADVGPWFLGLTGLWLLLFLFSLFRFIKDTNLMQIVAIALAGTLGLALGFCLVFFLLQLKEPYVMTLAITLSLVLLAIATNAMAALPWAFRLLAGSITLALSYFMMFHQYDYGYNGIGLLLLAVLPFFIRANNRAYQNLLKANYLTGQ